MKSYFNFNRKEKVGVVVLTTLILFFTVMLNVGYSTYVPDPLDVDLSSLEFIDINSQDKRNRSVNSNTQRLNTEQYSKEETLDDELIITEFDPNLIDAEKWMSFGFSEKQAASIIKYRDSYGPFRNKQQLQKLYVISDEKYAQLEPYIVIKNQSYSNKTDTIEQIKRYEPTKVEVVELNSATKEDLMRINGIGEYYADRILSYRNKIGGFVDPEQIRDMSIREEGISTILEMTTINASLVNKVDINSATKSELRNIPYSNWLTVARILEYREQQKITNLDFLSDTEISAGNKVKFEFYIKY